MIPEEELEKAIALARKYRVEEMYLVGSALYKDPDEFSDYDFAVKGIPEGNFFKFYSELFGEMTKDVDLIDLSGEMTKFKQLVIRDGKLIYDRASDQGIL